MRIIAGKYRSRLIKMPKSADVRPTKDRVRESLFAIIGEFVRGARVLDAFACSGAFGIEALSRGASSAVFIDNDKKCVDTINENLKSLGIVNVTARAIKMDTFKALDVLEREKEKFDLILLDPPYYGGLAKKSLIKLDSRDILISPYLIIAEHHKTDILPKELDNITSYRTACYGDICLSFYKAKR